MASALSHAVNMHFTIVTCHATVNAITGLLGRDWTDKGKNIYKTPGATETFPPDITKQSRNKTKTNSIVLTLFLHI